MTFVCAHVVCLYLPEKIKQKKLLRGKCIVLVCVNLEADWFFNLQGAM